MAACAQCTRPAMFGFGKDGEIPLCLDCSHKATEIGYLQFLQNAAMSNQALDDMDMVSGFSIGGGRIPVGAMAQAMRRSTTTTMNNITIRNSQVGVLNTGHLAKIDAAVTLTRESDAQNVGQQLAALTQAIIGSAQIDKPTRDSLIELLRSLSEEVVGQRKPAVLRSLARTILEEAGAISTLAPLAKQLWQALQQFMGG